MDWLNYHHLYYFWSVAKEGTITAACQQLRLSQPTISTQLRALEKSLGHRLLERQGRSLALTDAGRVVYSYANQIFSLGKELVDGLSGVPVESTLPLRVGVADVVSKHVVHLLLTPALQSPEPLQITCMEGKPAALMASLALHELDLVISDSPAPPEVKIRGVSHMLGESDLVIVGAAELARTFRAGFPNSLEGAPMLLPTTNTMLRRTLEYWFQRRGIRPRVVAEFEDTGQLRVFGLNGWGLFVVPAVVEDRVTRLHGVKTVGRIRGARMQYYGISLEQKLTHPGVISIVETAHKALRSRRS